MLLFLAVLNFKPLFRAHFHVAVSVVFLLWFIQVIALLPHEWHRHLSFVHRPFFSIIFLFFSSLCSPSSYISLLLLSWLFSLPLLRLQDRLSFIGPEEFIQTFAMKDPLENHKVQLGLNEQSAYISSLSPGFQLGFGPHSSQYLAFSFYYFMLLI